MQVCDEREFNTIAVQTFDYDRNSNQLIADFLRNKINDLDHTIIMAYGLISKDKTIS